jgi:hypothetical protein
VIPFLCSRYTTANSLAAFSLIVQGTKKLPKRKRRYKGRCPKLGKLGGFAKQMEAFSRQAKFNLLAVGKLAGILKKLDQNL